MERHEKAAARKKAATRAAQQAERPTVNTKDDIIRVIRQFDPNHRDNTSDNVKVSTELVGLDANDKRAKFNITAPTSSKSVRQIILDGLEMVRRRKETAAKIESMAQPVTINGKSMIPPPIMNFGRISIDSIIDRVTAGYRQDEFIQWDLPDGYTYKYNIFAHELKRFPREEDRNRAAGSI